MQLLVWSCCFLSVSFPDLLNGGFVVPVDLLCLLTFVRKFVDIYGCLVTDAKLVSEQDAESSYGGQNSNQDLGPESLLHGASFYGR
jgi:hypothetical protein